MLSSPLASSWHVLIPAHLDDVLNLPLFTCPPYHKLTDANDDTQTHILKASLEPSIRAGLGAPLSIPIFGRVRQEGHKFEASLYYRARPCTKMLPKTSTTKHKCMKTWCHRNRLDPAMLPRFHSTGFISNISDYW